MMISRMTMATMVTMMLISVSSSLSVERRQQRPDTADYRHLLLTDAPLMDVRAPIEYEKGSFPSARNEPLMTNDEREQVGICYSEKGQEAAIELGHSLVNGSTKAERIRKWEDFCTSFPENGYLYCARGGLRSNIAREWIEEETGIRYPLVVGGHKALRRYLLDELDRSLDPIHSEFVMVCGKTGTGKTRALDQLQHCSIDLEGLANHRGSSFGSFPGDEQPSQIDFENTISIDLLKLLDAASVRRASASAVAAVPILVEDEGNRIGRCNLPPKLKNRMETCDGGIILIEETTESRVDVIFEDYVVDLQQQYVKRDGVEEGANLYQEFLLGSLKRIKNRLGGDRHEQVQQTMVAAFREQEVMGDSSLHRVWIATLLETYYDKMYDYQFDKRHGEVIFRGCRNDAIDWANSRYT